MNRLPCHTPGTVCRPPRGAIRRPGHPRRAGFTLIEMLVSVALVLLMMTLFASIFQLATSAMSTQRSLAENDQRDRLVLNALRNDLGRRTMKLVLPFAANEDVTQPEAQLTLRQGYFYIREGLPDDDTDDILQFTMAVQTGEDQLYGVWGQRDPQTGQVGDLLMFLLASGQRRYGAGDDTSTPYTPNNSTNNYGIEGLAWANQPEFDDGAADVNHAAISPRAEVSYFLRNGTLYRRVLLIRQPASPAGATNGDPQDDQDGALNTEIFEAGGLNGVFENFYSDADFSAYYAPLFNNSGNWIGGKLKFHGAASLDNSGGGGLVSLGNPKYRFGHSVFTGLPRELADNGPAANSNYFIGRFTQAETSSVPASDPSRGFGYPGRISSNAPSPYDLPGNAANIPGRTLTYNPDTGAIAELPAGWRMAEDILMTNVQRFDIKVWDDGASFGPDDKAGRALFNDNSNFDANGNPIIDDLGEVGWPGTDDGDFRDLGHNGSTGFYRNHLDTLRNRYYSPVNQFRFDTWHPRIDFYNTQHNTLTPDGDPDPPPFRAALVGPDGQPGWSGYNDDQDFRRDANGNFVLDINGDKIPLTDDLNEVGWPGSDDIALPLRAIQIKITFLEPTTRQLRDVTMWFPLTPE